MEMWPHWLHALRLLVACAATAGLGIHAFYQHKLEAVQAVSPRKWMYWLYSVVFLLACVINFAQFCVTEIFFNYQKATFHLGYSTFLLALSYMALITGVKRRNIDSSPLKSKKGDEYRP